MKCPKCHLYNRPNRKFCAKCANPLQILCPSCHEINEPGEDYCGECGKPLAAEKSVPAPMVTTPVQPQPTSFANGRYQIKKFLGEGGKKKVYLAHDTVLDRDVAFALIKTEK